MEKSNFSDLIQYAPFGYAKQKIVLDNNDSPVDFILLEVNDVFLEIFGVDRSELLNKPITQLFPDIVKDEFNWIDFYGNIALNGGECGIEYFYQYLNKWFRIYVFSKEKGYFTTIFNDITEQKKQEQSLNKSLLDLEKSQEIAKVGSWELNLATNIFTSSKEGNRLFGFPENSSATFEEVTSLIFPDDRMVIREKFQLSLLKGIPYRVEFRIHRLNDNEVRHILSYGEVELNDKGEPIKVYGTNQDITELKSIHKAFLESESRYRSMFENAHAVMLIIDPSDGKIVDANPAATSFYGYSKDMIEKMNIFQINCLNEVELKSEMELAKAQKRNYFLFKHKLADGSIRDVEVFSGPIYIKDKLFLYSIVHDITERKKIEEALRESEERHRLLSDNATDVIWVMNRDGKFTYISPSVEKLRGYTPEEIMQQPPDELLTPNSLHHYLDGLKIISEKVAKGEPIRGITLELEQPCKDGSTVWTEASISGIYKPDGEFLGILGVTRNINEKKNAQYELEKYANELKYSKETIEKTLLLKNKLIRELEKTKLTLEDTIAQKDKFFSIIAHDLKSPFQGFLSLTKQFSEDIKNISLKDLSELSLILQNSAENIYKMLENLLEWSMIQRDMIEFNPIIVNMRELSDTVIGLQQNSINKKQIRISNNISEDIEISADLNLLMTVFRNLISNAVKFTPTNGEIELNCTKSFDSVILSIKDNGIGIPESLLKKLFVVGEHTSREGTNGESSTGLGLILCKEYVKKHGGSIWVDSKENFGSTFYFSLPI